MPTIKELLIACKKFDKKRTVVYDRTVRSIEMGVGVASIGEARCATGEGLAVERQLQFQKLKPGPGMPAAVVLVDQRRRLHGAIIALVDGEGWESVRVRTLTRAAGVSTSTFYKHFPNADLCFASAFDAVMGEALQRSAAAQRRRGDLRARLMAGVAALLEKFADEPRSARVALLDVFSAGPEARRRIGSAASDLERHFAGCLRNDPKTPAPRHLVAGMTAGVMRVARHTTAASRGDELPGLASELGEWMLSLPDPAVVTLLRAAGDPAVGRGDRLTLSAVKQKPRGVSAGNRERSLRAAVRIALTDGFAALTASRVRCDAGVSVRSFNDEFADLDECFLDGVETAASEALDQAVAWSSTTPDWAVRTCRAVLALCVQAARDRPLARIIFLEIFAPGKVGLLRREKLITEMSEALRSTIPAEVRPSHLAVEASIAAAWHIAQLDVAAGRTKELPKVAPLFSYVLLAPIIGPQTATRAIREASTVPV
jgi:AcrR family transcriptional regulator